MRTNRAQSLSGEARRALELLAQSARDANEELLAISRHYDCRTASIFSMAGAEHRTDWLARLSRHQV
jgi:hypothetical protein